MQNFDGEFSVANLILSVGVSANHSTANAVTFAPNNFNIEIMFNSNRLNRPPLDVARTLIHELIHAEIYRKLLSVAQQPEIPWSPSFFHSIRNDFPGLYDYYMRWHFNKPDGIDSTSPQHQLMAEHYRDTIEGALREIDNTQDNEVYESLAWIGLMGQGVVDQATGLPPNPTVAWENLSQQERIATIAEYNGFRISNPPCQN